MAAKTTPGVHSPSKLVSAFLQTIEHGIIPLTAIGVAGGNKVFGAAILRKDDLSIVIAATNQETQSPLLHGEISCIQQFYAIPQAVRPREKDCIFFATHEPCSLCLSGITWSGFDNFYYLFSYAQTRDAFAIPHDIKILQEVYKVPVEGESEERYRNRELYNRTNAFFTSAGVDALLKTIEEGEDKAKMLERIEDIQKKYGELSEVYQKSKGGAGIPLA